MVGDHLLVTLERFLNQTNEYKEVDFLLLIALGNMGKEKDEFKDSNSPL